MAESNKNYSQSQINWFYAYTANKLKTFPNYTLNTYYRNAIFNYILENSDFTDEEILRCYNITNSINDKFGEIHQNYINFMLSTIDNIENIDRKLDLSLILFYKLKDLDLLSSISTSDIKEIINEIIANDIPTKYIYINVCLYMIFRTIQKMDL